MSATRREREEFIARMTKEGVDLDTARKLLSAAATLQRLSEAQCNGDWPADNGERKVVYCGGAESEGCGGMWVPSVLMGQGKRCPDCRTEARVLKLCAAAKIGPPQFNGDPRGAVLRVAVPSGREDYTGAGGICVPS